MQLEDEGPFFLFLLAYSSALNSTMFIKNCPEVTSLAAPHVCFQHAKVDLLNRETRLANHSFQGHLTIMFGFLLC